MEYIKLIKLMYLADRTSILEADYPITGDTFYALKKGPIVSRVMNFIRGKKRDATWSGHFTTSGHSIELTDDPGNDDLSEKDEK